MLVCPLCFMYDDQERTDIDEKGQIIISTITLNNNNCFCLESVFKKYIKLNSESN